MAAVVVFDGAEVVVEAFDLERLRNTGTIGAIDGRSAQPGRVELMRSPDHTGRDALTLWSRLQLPLLVAHGPENDRGRVAVAFDHGFELRESFGAGAHQAGL